MMRTLDDIIRLIEEHKEEIRKKFRVKEIGVFGSYVRGEMKETSDVDVLVEFEENAKVSLIDFLKLENYLSEILGVRVDLVEKGALKPNIGKRVLKETVFV
ncbi:MAG: nucleotidyltransferase family protein [Archaeoglobales archaeon]|nr:nucleotidyltransferase family protein [Archaeoglobales archaeon]